MAADTGETAAEESSPSSSAAADLSAVAAAFLGGLWALPPGSPGSLESDFLFFGLPGLPRGLLKPSSSWSVSSAEELAAPPSWDLLGDDEVEALLPAVWGGGGGGFLKGEGC